MFGWLNWIVRFIWDTLVYLLNLLFVQVPLYLFESVVNVSRWIARTTRRLIVAGISQGRNEMNRFWNFILGPTMNDENPEYTNSDLSHRNYSAEALWGICMLPVGLLWILVDSRITTVLFWALMLLTVLSIRIVPQPQRFVIAFVGRYFATWKPGIHMLPPGFVIKNRLTLAVKRVEMFMDGKVYTFRTIEGKEVKKIRSQVDFLDDSAGVALTFMYRVTNPFKVTYKVDKFLATLLDRIEASTRAVLSQLKLDDAIKVKGEVGKLIASTFLKPGKYEIAWSNLRAKSAYKQGTEDWDDSPENPFNKASALTLPFFEKEAKLYLIDDWGVVFSAEGMVVVDFILNPATIKQRIELLRANRGVRIADRERQADQLKGRGRKQRLQEIAEVLGGDGESAADYDIADKMTEAMKTAKPVIVSESLTRNVLSKIAGFGSAVGKSKENDQDNAEDPPNPKKNGE